MSQGAQVKKVKAYPFPAEIKAEIKGTPVSLKGQVVKLVQTGGLIDVPGTALQPGDKIDVQFETPVLHGAVSTAAVVVKVTSQLKGIARLEVHFRNLPDDQLSRITNFLIQTGQARK